MGDPKKRIPNYWRYSSMKPAIPASNASSAAANNALQNRASGKVLLLMLAPDSALWTSGQFFTKFEVSVTLGQAIKEAFWGLQTQSICIQTGA